MKYLLLAATDVSNIPLAVYDTEQAALADLKNWDAENVIFAAERQYFPDRDPAKVESISLSLITGCGLIQFVRIVRDFRSVTVRYYDHEIRIAPNGVDNNSPEFFTALRTAIDRHLERLK